MAWAEGVKAFFNGDRKTFLPKFREGLAVDDSALRARRLLFLAEHDADNAITYLREAVKAKPESRQAHVALCLALEEAKDWEALQQAVADAIVEADAWSDRRQRPLAFLRELSSQPWWCNEALPWVQELERLSPLIRGHLEALMPLLHHASGPQPPWAVVGGDHRLSGSNDGEAVTQGSWHEVVLFGYGHENQDEICRPLMGILRNLLPDAVSLAEAGAGEVILSALAPHTEVAPHCARANHRLTAHLGLVIPKTGDPFLCGIRVGEEWRCWQQDKVIIFDDSFEHEVCNRSPSTRVVLLIRFWHPDLQTETQRLGALQRMQMALARHQQLQVLPPLAPAFHEPSQALEEHFLGAGLCPGCSANQGGDLILDEERKCIRLISRCCGYELQ